MLYIVLSKAQQKAIAKARGRTSYMLKLTKKQVASAAVFDTVESALAANPGYVGIPLTKQQQKSIAKAQAGGRPVSVTISKTALQRGGFFGAIVPALASLLPGLLTPEVADGFVKGFENFGKLIGLGNEAKGSSLQLQGTGTVVTAPLFKSPEALKNEGSSLRLHGESLKVFGENADRKSYRMKAAGLKKKA